MNLRYNLAGPPSKDSGFEDTLSGFPDPTRGGLDHHRRIFRSTPEDRPPLDKDHCPRQTIFGKLDFYSRERDEWAAMRGRGISCGKGHRLGDEYRERFPDRGRAMRWSYLLLLLTLFVVSNGLGQEGRPSLQGRVASITDPGRLKNVKSIYVARIENNLHEKLTEALTRWGHFKLVGDQGAADAILQGTCFESRRLKTVHSEVYLRDARSGNPIWQDNVRRPYNPPTLAKALEDSAGVMVNHLRDDFMRSMRQ